MKNLRFKWYRSVVFAFKRLCLVEILIWLPQTHLKGITNLSLTITIQSLKCLRLFYVKDVLYWVINIYQV